MTSSLLAAPLPPTLKAALDNTEQWQAIRQDAQTRADADPLAAPLLEHRAINHPTLADALAAILGAQISDATLHAPTITALFLEAAKANPNIEHAVMRDLEATLERDPACHARLDALLFAKGFHAILAYRLAHTLWHNQRTTLAYQIQSRASQVYGVDIHPAAKLGSGIMFDHATGIVVGETAQIADDVSLLHGVTLGGTGAQRGQRHPKVERGAMIGASASVLGAIVIGEGTLVGAGSVVLSSTPPHCTVVGAPARVVGECRDPEPARTMNQNPLKTDNPAEPTS